MTNFLFLTGEAAAATPTAGGSMLSMFLPIVLIFVVFYFFLIRPEKKRKKEIDSMRSGLKVGDKITTIGGIVGKVIKVNNKKDLITIETSSDKTKLCIARWAVGTKENVDETVEEAVEENTEENND